MLDCETDPMTATICIIKKSITLSLQNLVLISINSILYYFSFEYMQQNVS